MHLLNTSVGVYVKQTQLRCNCDQTNPATDMAYVRAITCNDNFGLQGDRKDIPVRAVSSSLIHEADVDYMWDRRE